MASAFDTVDKAILELEQLQRALAKIKTSQVNSRVFCLSVKTAVRSWFETHRKSLEGQISQKTLQSVDTFYQVLLEQSSRRSLKNRYRTVLSNLRDGLISLRSGHCLLKGVDKTNIDVSPDFSTLIPDQMMGDILARRWQECSFCVQSRQAPLSAVVMMGGMLEGLLLARVNNTPDKGKIFRTKAAPKDKSGKVSGLKDWTLNNYIDVAHELGWVSQPVKDISVVLRDYRNYIHPHKEYSMKLNLHPDDAAMLWSVCKSITLQILCVK